MLVYPELHGPYAARCRQATALQVPRPSLSGDLRTCCIRPTAGLGTLLPWIGELSTGDDSLAEHVTADFESTVSAAGLGVRRCSEASREGCATAETRAAPAAATRSRELSDAESGECSDRWKRCHTQRPSRARDGSISVEQELIARWPGWARLQDGV